ncbi:efflux RND transporter permease subunit [Serratia ureilytica]
MLSILIFVAGVIAIPLLPISEYPDVVPPSVQVRAEYPGANPKEIAETVATPLEEAINGVENMMYMKSVAGSDGVLVTTVTFRPGTDPDQARCRCKTAWRRPKRACRKTCAARHHHPETVPGADAGGASGLAFRQVRFAVPAQLRHPESQG